MKLATGYGQLPWPVRMSVAMTAAQPGESALRTLNTLASHRGQSLAQMALSWVLRDHRVTSVVVGASSVRQLEDNVAAIERTEFTDQELAAINRAAVDHPETDLWREQAQIGVDPGAPHRDILKAAAT